jgi:hypothetical protein
MEGETGVKEGRVLGAAVGAWGSWSSGVHGGKGR